MVDVCPSVGLLSGTETCWVESNVACVYDLCGDWMIPSDELKCICLLYHVNILPSHMGIESVLNVMWTVGWGSQPPESLVPILFADCTKGCE